MKHFGKARKKSKDTEEVLKSQVYQAIKTVSKVVKTVKGLLVLKCSKKIASIREGESDSATAVDNKLESEIKWLETLKEIDHQVVGAAIVRAKVPFGGDSRYNSTDKSLDNTIDHDVMRAMLKHKKVLDAVAEIEAKIMGTIAKNNELRAKEQEKASKVTAKSLFSKKNGYVDGSKAVFMDSLSSAGVAVEKKEVSNQDLVKLNKSLRNQANRLANRQKRLQTETETADVPYTKQIQDSNNRGGVEDDFRNKRQKKDDRNPKFNMYRPLDQRFAEPAASSDSNNTASNGNRSRPSSDGTRQGKPGGSGGNRTPSSAAPARDRPSSKAGQDRPRTAAAAQPAAVPTEELTRAASFGKEWQKTGVHPSWAAKQHAKQQTVGAIPTGGVAAGQGKKIVFDD